MANSFYLERLYFGNFKNICVNDNFQGEHINRRGLLNSKEEMFNTVEEFAEDLHTLYERGYVDGEYGCFDDDMSMKEEFCCLFATAVSKRLLRPADKQLVTFVYDFICHAIDMYLTTDYYYYCDSEFVFDWYKEWYESGADFDAIPEDVKEPEDKLFEEKNHPLHFFIVKENEEVIPTIIYRDVLIREAYRRNVSTRIDEDFFKEMLRKLGKDLSAKKDFQQIKHLVLSPIKYEYSAIWSNLHASERIIVHYSFLIKDFLEIDRKALKVIYKTLGIKLGGDE